MQKIDEFLKSNEGLAKNTLDKYAMVLNGHFVPFLEKPSVIWTSLTKDVAPLMPDFCTALKRKGLSGASIQQHITVVKIFFRWLGFPITYSHKISNAEKKLKRLKNMNRWFCEDDIERCLAYRFPSEHNRNAIIVRLLIETGARIRELGGLKKKDIDMDNNMIWITISKTEPRFAFFSNETLLMLSEHLAGLLFDDAPLFPCVGQMKNIVQNMLKALDMKTPGDGRGPHNFRHWFATTVYFSGMRIEDVAMLMGDTVDIILKTYIHPTPKMMQERVNRAMGW